MATLPATPAKIELVRVSHLYLSPDRAFLALKEINLRVEEGEFVCLVGPSGCGKTTLLSLMAGLERPTSGSVRIDGVEVTGPSPRVGYMLQQDYLFNWRTIEENILLGLDIQGNRTMENVEFALHLLDEMGLYAYRHSYPHQLSGGMRQRVALVRTLACRPDILLLDEPFSALDYRTRLKLEDLVVDTLRRQHPPKTAVLVTHDLSEAVAMGDRVLVMERRPGRIKSELAVPDDIRAALPFAARNSERFPALIQHLWNGMEDDADATP